jgi:ankyrin repeat protein
MRSLYILAVSSIIFFAVFTGCSESIEKKINRAGYEADGQGLIDAVKNNDLETVKLFIENKTPLNFADPIGATALMYAAKINDPRILQLLVDSGAEVMISDNSKKTALHYAVAKGYEKNAIILLEKGVDPLWKDNYGRDAFLTLLSVAPTANMNIFKALIDRKADINGRDNDRKTPLIIAVERNIPGYAQALISMKANPLAKDYKGMTALDYAREKLEKNEISPELAAKIEEFVMTVNP